jgi:prephenate dehydrogenase
MRTWDKLAVVGPGLIGGSVGLAALRRGVASDVVGIGRSQTSLQAAVNLGVITEATLDLDAGVREADLIVVCTPVDDIPHYVQRAAACCRPGTLITDAGSTKVQIVERVERAQAAGTGWGEGVRFVGSHPLAGNDKRGSDFANADLFVDRTVVVTPTPGTRPEDVQAVRDFWEALGAVSVVMSPEEHDRAVAVTSHLPHLVAAAIAAATPAEYVTLTAGGWQDTTRIAAGDPLLWRQIFLANVANLLSALERFDHTLRSLRLAVEAGDAAGLERLLTEGKRIRDAVGN